MMGVWIGRVLDWVEMVRFGEGDRWCIQRWLCWVFFFQAEDGIRGLVRSRGLGDVYKRQILPDRLAQSDLQSFISVPVRPYGDRRLPDHGFCPVSYTHLTLPTIYSVSI